jgi:small subunit ribosomal protein S20
MLRTSIKKVLAAVESSNKDAAVIAYKAATPVIDSMVNKGIIHRNMADRTKSRLNTRVQSL